MKKIMFFTVLFLFFMNSCDKQVSYNITSELYPISSEDFKSYLFANGDSDCLSNIVIQNEEYSDQIISNVSSTVWAIFKMDSLDGRINVGSLMINNEVIPFDLDRRSYLRYRGRIPESEIGAYSIITLQSSSEYFNSFTDSLYVGNRLSVRSSLGLGDFFEKNQNLNISWSLDHIHPNQKVYVAVACTGSPIVIKEYENSSDCSIPSSEFSGFNIGADVFVFVGRGYKKIINIGNGKTICVYFVQYSKSKRYVVS